ncbi:hypothetical protein BSL82_05320 [Tardibacter chloracetimidivorans]|uniref:Crp/Fnr family transcriptional regulator n=1 Tax=Tardibacter chloracetimidivorans TaxID=1921510 RepID=A0A1L3ZT53_9SPHN|nr:Crp/Fnr family transcriptional regulator [Tardibacter chloracetimidivorans]API58798.1 hypothetical protein BSL82_05320 [Tardibacter chloracetimidivorans]
MTGKISQSDKLTQTPCFQCPLRECEGLRPLSDEQLEFTWSLKSGELHLERGGDILVQGSISPHLYTLLRGIAFRFKELEDGRRQIVNYLFPGDLVGLQGAMAEPLGHGVEALTPVTLCVLPRGKLYEIFRVHPELGFDMTWLGAKEEEALDGHLLALGRRKADERIVHFALYLFHRGQQTGLSRKNTLEIPVTQSQLADSLGISLVHTNKTLQSLRKRRILDWQPNQITFLDMEKAEALAGPDFSRELPRPYI